MMRTCTEIISDIIDASAKEKIAGRELKEFDLSVQDYSELMKCPMIKTDFRPQPPVCAKASWSGGGGLFSSPISGSYEARDYRAPEYLEALEKYVKDKNRDDRPMVCGVRINLNLEARSLTSI